MTNKIILGMAIVAAMAGSGAAFGQGLLDQQLGPTAPAAEPKKDAAPDAKAPEKTPVVDAAKPEVKKPAANDIVSSDAAKKVDDDELLKQLLDPNAKPDPSEVAKRLRTMVERMKQTEKLLTADKNPGDITQETQRRIVADLDVMIELARQQQQQQSSSSSQKPQPGQERQPTPPQGGKSGEGGNVAATTDPLSRGGYSDPAAGGDMRSKDPSNWGNLPPRDRDQVSHGANEQYLTSYRDQIDRYYQALAEMARSHGR